MTDLHKKISRRTERAIRDAGRLRRLVVTLYPGDVLGLRPEKTRREEIIGLEACWSLAVKTRVAKELREKKEARKAKRRQ